MGAHQRGDCGLWICDWAFCDCVASTECVSGASNENDRYFGLAGNDFDSGWRGHGDCRVGAISQDAHVAGAGKISARRIYGGYGDNPDGSVRPGAGGISDLRGKEFVSGTARQNSWPTKKKKKRRRGRVCDLSKTGRSWGWARDRRRLILFNCWASR